MMLAFSKADRLLGPMAMSIHESTKNAREAKTNYFSLYNNFPFDHRTEKKGISMFEVRCSLFADDAAPFLNSTIRRCCCSCKDARSRFGDERSDLRLF
jgi:hypothetical protein